jgi:Flp pilus assembly protein TadD
MLARTLDAHNELSESVAESEKAARLSGGSHASTAQLGCAYARIGDTAKAHKIIDQLVELSQTEYVSPYDIAIIYTGLGEKDLALVWLEKAYEERAVRLLELPDPAFDDLRFDPRFQDLVQRIGLPR